MGARPALSFSVVLKIAFFSSSCSFLREASSDEQGPKKHERVSRPPGRGGGGKRGGDRRDGPLLAAPPDEEPEPPRRSAYSSPPFDVFRPLPELVEGHGVDPLGFCVPVHGIRVN